VVVVRRGWRVERRRERVAYEWMVCGRITSERV
jgi:hypothetical protein